MNLQDRLRLDATLAKEGLPLSDCIDKSEVEDIGTWPQRWTIGYIPSEFTTYMVSELN